MSGIERYREDDRERPYVTDADFQAMMEVAVARGGKLAVRDQAILSFLFSTGVRAHELIGVDLDDVIAANKALDPNFNPNLIFPGEKILIPKK